MVIIVQSNFPETTFEFCSCNRWIIISLYLWVIRELFCVAAFICRITVPASCRLHGPLLASARARPDYGLARPKAWYLRFSGRAGYRYQSPLCIVMSKGSHQWQSPQHNTFLYYYHRPLDGLNCGEQVKVMHKFYPRSIFMCRFEFGLSRCCLLSYR